MKINTAENKKSFLQFIRFALIGVMNTAIDYILFAILLYLLRIHWTIANVIAYASAVLFSYFANKYWTFKKKTPANFIEILRMYGVNIVSLGFSTAVIYSIVNILMMPDITVIIKTTSESLLEFVIKKELTAKILSVPVVVIINFIGTKLLVFKK